MLDLRSVISVCLLSLLVAPLLAIGAERSAATMPLKSGTPYIPPRSLKGPGKAQSIRPYPGLPVQQKGFSSNPFALGHRDPPGTGQQQQKRVRYEAGGRRQEEKVSLGSSEKLSVTSQSNVAPDDRLIPQRAPFSGGKFTMPYMDEELPSPEVSMHYKLNDNTSTRVTVNPQDQTSPLYRPAEQEGFVNSAGVYMDVNVKDDLQLQIGGEYCDLEAGASSTDGSSRGASVGLKWNF